MSLFRRPGQSRCSRGRGHQCTRRFVECYFMQGGHTRTEVQQWNGGGGWRKSRLHDSLRSWLVVSIRAVGTAGYRCGRQRRWHGLSGKQAIARPPTPGSPGVLVAREQTQKPRDQRLEDFPRLRTGSADVRELVVARTRMMPRCDECQQEDGVSHGDVPREHPIDIADPERDAGGCHVSARHKPRVSRQNWARRRMSSPCRRDVTLRARDWQRQP